MAGWLRLEMIVTGHEIFDEIASLDLGITVLLLDENFTEAISFIDGILGAPNREAPNNVTEIHFSKPLLKNSQQLFLTETSLSYVSTSINRFRGGHRGRLVVHTYLPGVLVNHPQESVLRLIESWKSHIMENETVEFFILPKGAFNPFEKIFKSVVDRVLEISRAGEPEVLNLTVIRSPKPEYQMRNFEYILQGGRPKIRWGEDFLDRMPLAQQDIGEKVRYLVANMPSIKVTAGPNKIPPHLSIRERLIMSQLVGKDLELIMAIFPDKGHEMMEKLVKWNQEGFIDFASSASSLPRQVKRKLSLRTRIFLRFPAALTTFYIARKGLSSYVMPAEGYLMRRKVDEAFYSTLFPEGIPPSLMDLVNIEDFLQDLTTRFVSYNVVKSVGEDPRNRLDMSLAPKVLDTMLRVGYSCAAHVRKVKENAFELSVKECPICKGEKSKSPYCVTLSGAIKGNAVVCFKKPATCVETSCIAMGDEACTFYLEFGELKKDEGTEHPPAEDALALPHSPWWAST